MPLFGCLLLLFILLSVGRSVKCIVQKEAGSSAKASGWATSLAASIDSCVQVRHEYTHCHGRVTFTTTRLDKDARGKLESGLPANRIKGMMAQPEAQEIYMWGVCKICDAVCGPLPMSEGAKQYSFARYLEQMFHGHSFVCGAPG